VGQPESCPSHRTSGTARQASTSTRETDPAAVWPRRFRGNLGTIGSVPPACADPYPGHFGAPPMRAAVRSADFSGVDQIGWCGTDRVSSLG